MHPYRPPGRPIPEAHRAQQTRQMHWAGSEELSAVLLCHTNSVFPEVDLTRHSSTLLHKRDLEGADEERLSVAPDDPDFSLGCPVAVGRHFPVRYVRIRRPPVWAFETGHHHSHRSMHDCCVLKRAEQFASMAANDALVPDADLAKAICRCSLLPSRPAETTCEPPVPCQIMRRAHGTSSHRTPSA